MKDFNTFRFVVELLTTGNHKILSNCYHKKLQQIFHKKTHFVLQDGGYFCAKYLFGYDKW